MNEQPHPIPAPLPPRHTKPKKAKEKKAETLRQLVIEMGTFVLCFD